MNIYVHKISLFVELPRCSYFRYLYLSLSYLFFFFLMIRRPPRSTLFPSRRSSDLRFGRMPAEQGLIERLRGQQPGDEDHHQENAERSEEHTSELQSRRDLVCRLLLEKKKKKKTIHTKQITSKSAIYFNTI